MLIIFTRITDYTAKNSVTRKIYDSIRNFYTANMLNFGLVPSVFLTKKKALANFFVSA